MRRPPLSLLAVAAVQQLAFWAVVLSNNPQTSVTFDCVGGAMGRDILQGFAYSPLDTFDGVLGGMFVAALFGAPVYSVLGFSGFALKAVAGLWALGTLLVFWWFLDRTFGRLAAVVGGLTLALPMPTAFLSSTIPGHWHYTELAFEIGAAGIFAAIVWWKEGQRAVQGTAKHRGVGAIAGGLALGLLSGVAFFNCFGSLILFAALWMLAWVLLRSRWGWRGLISYAVGLVVGATPLWFKVLVHAPYGARVASEGGTKVPQEALSASIDPGKLRDLFIDNGFSWGLHFQDVLGTPPGTVFSMTLATGVTLGLFGGWLLLMVRVTPSLKALARGGVSGADPTDVSPAVIPAVMGAVYAVAWFFSDMSVVVLPWHLSNIRELGHITMIPWAAVMALSGAVLLASLQQERAGSLPAGERPLPPATRWVLGAGLVWVIGAGAIGVTAAIDDRHLPGLRSAFRGQCHDVHGVYMGPHIVGPHARTADGNPLDPTLTPERSDVFCRAYGPSVARECGRGVAWSLGFAQMDAATGELDPRNDCLRLPQEWRAECLRGIGWALQSAGEGAMVTASPETARCDDFAESPDRAACWRGVGFPLGDHLHNQPMKLMRALEEFDPAVRVHVARGAATHVGRMYSSMVYMQGMCADWDEEYRAACADGVEDSLRFRSDAEAVRAR